MSVKQRLEHAAMNNTLVRVFREAYQDEYVVGYVVDTGKEHFVIEVISAAIEFDGYYCLRYVDVSRCDIPDPSSNFLEKALSLRGEKRTGNPGTDLSTVATILSSASGVFATVNIWREQLEPRVCYIGRVIELTDASVTLRTITPNGEWEREFVTFGLVDITRVDFGGRYEEVLVLVADDTRVH